MKIILNLLITFVWLLAGLTTGVAQSQVDPTSLVIMPSPKGNYLFVQPVAPEASDSIQQLHTAYYQIKRLALVKKTSMRYLEQLYNGKPAEDLKLSEVGQLRRPQTMAEVRNLVSEEFIGYLKQATEQPTDEQFLSFLNTHSNPIDYGVLGGEVALQLVLGNVYLDTDVTPGMMYLYQAIRVDKSNKKTIWAQGITVAGAENETLARLNTRLSAVTGIDSLVTVKWDLPIKSLNSTPKTPISQHVDPQDQASRRTASSYPTEPRTIRASVWLFKDNNWTKESTVIPTMNAAGDTLTFYWSKPCIPEEVVRVFLLPQDMVENPGTPSDTATAVAIGNNKVKLIYGAKAQDTTDAIRVSWAQLPVKPYYTGIEIARDNGADSTFSVVAQVTPSDSVFYDYYVRPGVSYTYRVRPLFIPLQGLAQPVAAEALATATKFTRPLPVSNLQAQREGKHIRLTWEGVDSPSLFSYYVYRGASPDKLVRVTGTLGKNTTYLDSSSVLSGRLEYFYSVMTMSLTQDTSDLAPAISIRPLRSIETTYPKTVEATFIDKEAWLSWHDVRTEDNILTGFIIQRRSEPNGTFRPLTQTVLDQPSFTDTTLREGQTAWYRVAAVTAFGDTTTFSEATELALPLTEPDPVFTFYVRNTTSGVEVSWPGVDDGKREKYGIYRREANSATFTKIGEASNKDTQFLDTQVRGGTKYVYSVTSIEAANRESKRVKSQAIVRD